MAYANPLDGSLLSYLLSSLICETLLNVLGLYEEVGLSSYLFFLSITFPQTGQARRLLFRKLSNGLPELLYPRSWFEYRLAIKDPYIHFSDHRIDDNLIQKLEGREVECGLRLDADKVAFGEYAQQWIDARTRDDKAQQGDTQAPQKASARHSTTRHRCAGCAEPIHSPYR